MPQAYKIEFPTFLVAWIDHQLYASCSCQLEMNRQYLILSLYVNIHWRPVLEAKSQNIDLLSLSRERFDSSMRTHTKKKPVS